MATGCCGVKKQKLSSASIAATTNGTSSYNRSSSGSNRNGLLTNGCSSTNRSNGGAYANGGGNNNDSSSSPSSSNYGREFSRTSQLRQQTRIINAEMVVFCFDVLYSYLHSTEPPKPPKFTNDHFPLFVTWKMGKDKKLRGCIGTFNSTSLHQGLREYAITSACKDSRFDPINVDEFARLHCSVSLLTDFEVASHYLDWEIGIHGIRIEFCSEKGSKKAATYLPEVAIEQGWTQIQTIDSLLRKGGFKGAITPEIRGNVCLIRFQSEKMTVSYHEYVSHKQNPFGAYSEMSPSKSPVLNGATMVVETRNGYADRSSLPAAVVSGNTSSNSIGHYRTTTHSHTYHNHRHGHSTSTHSVAGTVSPPNETTNSAQNGATRHGGYWRNHNRSNSGSRRSPIAEPDSPRQTSSSSAVVNNAARYLTLPTHHTYMPPPGL